PRERWWFLPPEGETGDPDFERQFTRIALEGGFQPGRIYELVYRAQDPRVLGLGLAAVRDILSYAKYELDSLFPVNLGVAFGVSQTGRFLRHYLYQGLNTDEGGRKVFDGMLIHAAGAGRGSFNHRFGQASRGAHRFSDFFYPTDLFPFTARVQRDPVSGREEGLFAGQRPRDLPLIFYTNTGYEYWGRAGSLIHTSVDGSHDIEPLENERIYHLASAQESGWADPLDEADRLADNPIPVLRGNPVDLSFPLRALGLRLVEWVEGTREPPPSAFPRIGNGSLVPPSALAFPNIPGVAVPDVIHEAYRVDYGGRWWEEGIIDKEPPELVGTPFPSLVSQVDGLGNELAGVRGWELRAPVATYAPWNLRWGFQGAQDELTNFRGTFIPLSRTEEERASRGDPRPSIEALYPHKELYLERVRAATRDLYMEGFMLFSDGAAAVEIAEARWDWIVGLGG
ncbi:MAG: alpha/beta hydrolase domain-containing protein, partial [Gemmatimonadota bacterium]